MNRALAHRGPDGAGTAELGFGALGMARLAIMDPEGGVQPMSTGDGRWTLVYNGELYDHAALRERLEERGCRFHTRSDTEVLLHSWALDGPACLGGINGMFGFAVADRRERTLCLARDPLGIKPLYYHLCADGELIFSSELAALLEHPKAPRVLDRRSLEMLLVDRCVGDPWTLFDGIFQLPPGHWLRWKDGEIELHRYWRFEIEPRPCAEPSALDELRERLQETVRSQLVADVPVGVFLSGGIDSSTVAAFAARSQDAPLHSFSVGFAHPDYDESPLAREVARHLGTEHHEVRVENARFDPSLLDAIVDHAGQPLADLSCIPTWIVSRFARREVKVVLSGDGGDELFGGYDHLFWAARVRRASERTPALLRRVAHTVLAGMAPMPLRGAQAGARRARKGLELSFHEPREQLRRLMSLWSPEQVRELLAEASPAPLRRTTAEQEEEGLAPEEHAMTQLARTYLPAAILAKVDRMSMAAGLEVRVPLLDRRIVEFATRLPLQLKMRGRTGKHLLREAARDLLPGAVYRHRKQGFTLPLHAWFNAEFWELLDGLYAPGARAAQLFERRALEAAIADGRRAHAQGARLSAQAAAARVWLLALLGRWMERFEVTA